MNRIIVEIDNPSNTKRFINILEDLKYIRFFAPENDGVNDLTPLTDEDWSKPGRPATDAEFEQLAIAMEQDKGGHDPETALEMTLKEIEEWRMGKLM